VTCFALSNLELLFSAAFFLLVIFINKFFLYHLHIILYTSRFGMLFSLKDLVSKLSPGSASNSDNMNSMRTDTFTLHHYQSVTGLMFVLNTDSQSYDVHMQLEFIYKNIFIEYLSRNPLYNMKPDEPITCPLFAQKLEEYITSLPCWKS
jgi:hypothetical protein